MGLTFILQRDSNEKKNNKELLDVDSARNKINT